MWEFLHSASQFLNINTYKHAQTHTQTHRAWGCLTGYLTEWPITMVTAALHQSIQGTDGRCATGGICFNEHTHTQIHTHTCIHTRTDTHTHTHDTLSLIHTHAWMRPRSEGGYWTTSSICSTSQIAFIQTDRESRGGGRERVKEGGRDGRRWKEIKEEKKREEGADRELLPPPLEANIVAPSADADMVLRSEPTSQSSMGKQVLCYILCMRTVYTLLYIHTVCNDSYIVYAVKPMYT